MILLQIWFSFYTDRTAYLDPGSGSLIVQLLLAAILGVGVLIRTQWNNIKSLFTKKTAIEDNNDSLPEK